MEAPGGHAAVLYTPTIDTGVSWAPPAHAEKPASDAPIEASRPPSPDLRRRDYSGQILELKVPRPPLSFAPMVTGLFRSPSPPWTQTGMILAGAVPGVETPRHQKTLGLLADQLAKLGDSGYRLNWFALSQRRGPSGGAAEEFVFVSANRAFCWRNLRDHPTEESEGGFRHPIYAAIGGAGRPKRYGATEVIMPVWRRTADVGAPPIATEEAPIGNAANHSGYVLRAVDTDAFLQMTEPLPALQGGGEVYLAQIEAQRSPAGALQGVKLEGSLTGTLLYQSPPGPQPDEIRCGELVDYVLQDVLGGRAAALSVRAPDGREVNVQDQRLRVIDISELSKR